jgi:hypothetical protein
MKKLKFREAQPAPVVELGFETRSLHAGIIFPRGSAALGVRIA